VEKVSDSSLTKWLNEVLYLGVIGQNQKMQSKVQTLAKLVSDKADFDSAFN